MRSDDKLYDLFMDLLQDVYGASDPSLDFKKFYKSIQNGKKKCPPKWFQEHEISDDKLERIEKKFKKQNKITELEWRRLAWLRLDYYPSTSEDRRKRDDRKRKEVTRENQGT